MKTDNKRLGENGSKRLYSLLIALILMSGFALVFYKSMLTKKSNDAGTQKAFINPKVERLIIEEVQNEKKKSKHKEKNKPEENFTFYKTLTDVKKPKIDPVAELLRTGEKTDKNVNRGEVKKEKEEKVAFNNEERNEKTPISANRGIKYSVQLASFSDFERADDFLKEMKRKGYSPFIMAAEHQSKTHFRVRIGNFEQREQALTESKLINDKENLHSIVVKE